MNEYVKMKIGNQDVELVSLSTIRMIIKQEVNRQFGFVVLGLLIGYAVAHII